MPERGHCPEREFCAQAQCGVERAAVFGQRDSLGAHERGSRQARAELQIGGPAIDASSITSPRGLVAGTEGVKAAITPSTTAMVLSLKTATKATRSP